MIDIDYVYELAESHKALNEAGWEIERLRAENEKLRAALKPFEKEADGCGYYDMKDCDAWQLPVSMIRAAAAALKETGDE